MRTHTKARNPFRACCSSITTTRTRTTRRKTTITRRKTIITTTKVQCALAIISTPQHSILVTRRIRGNIVQLYRVNNDNNEIIEGVMPLPTYAHN